MSKAYVSTVRLGNIEIEGLMLPDGSFGVSLRQLRELAFPSTSQNNALRELKSACGKGFEIKLQKVLTSLNNNPQWVIPIDLLKDVLYGLSLRGHKEAQQVFAKAYGIKAKKENNKKPKQKQGYIYLFEGSNILKLGYSTNVEQRIKTLSRWDGELELVAKIKGTINKEKSLHSMLHNTGDYFGDEWYPVYRKHEILNLMDIEHKVEINV